MAETIEIKFVDESGGAQELPQTQPREEQPQTPRQAPRQPERFGTNQAPPRKDGGRDEPVNRLVDQLVSRLQGTKVGQVVDRGRELFAGGAERVAQARTAFAQRFAQGTTAANASRAAGIRAGIAGGATSIAARLSGVLGPVAVAGTAVVAALTSLAGIAKKLTDEFEQQAEQSARFFGPLAFARASAEVTRTRQEIERARRLGPGLTEFQLARNRREEAEFGLQTTIKKGLLDVFGPLATEFEGLRGDVATISELLLETGEPTRNILGEFVRYQFDLRTAAIQIVGDLANIIKNQQDEKRREDAEKFENFDPLMMEIINLELPGGLRPDQQGPLPNPLVEGLEELQGGAPGGGGMF